MSHVALRAEPAIRDRKGTLPEARVVVAVVVEPISIPFVFTSK
jgi:hypothetical protein